MTECDRIAAAAHEAFTRVYGSIAEEMLGRKVLAAILIKNDQNPDGKVAALGTGWSNFVLRLHWKTLFWDLLVFRLNTKDLTWCST